MAVDQFCLKWNNFQSSIVSAFESLQSTEDLADVTLSTEGINIKAHKIILSACSPYFRTVFKENPCSHPIVILKDILYNDLLAVLNYMYHGEVLVSKDRLHSFLQTAEMLQVSGLIGCADVALKSSSKPSFKSHKSKEPEVVHSAPKRTKLTPRNKKQEVGGQNLEADSHAAQEKLVSQRDVLSANNFEIVPVDQIKTEVDEDNLQTEVNVNVKHGGDGLEKPVSILETVLEVKDSPTSILERSLMSYPPTGKSPTVNYPMESSLHHTSSELAKHLAPQKPPDTVEIDKRMQKYEHLSLTRSDLSVDNQSLKTEEEEKLEAAFDVQTNLSDVNLTNVRPPQEVQPHHSSQCGNCPHCGKVYSNQSALKYHVRFVHSGLLNLYCCHLCPEAFDYREGYKKHMVEVHSLRN